TLSPFTRPSHASRYEPASRGSEWRSRSSPPATTSSTSAASRTVRVMGPTWETPANPPGNPRPSGTRPYEGLKPSPPQNAAVERAERLALRDRDLRLARRGARLLGGDDAERVEGRVDRVDPRQDRVRHLDRRELLGSHEAGDFESRLPDEHRLFALYHSASCSPLIVTATR